MPLSPQMQKLDRLIAQENKDRAHPHVQRCRDCGARISEGGVTTGVASGSSCRACYEWRVERGAVFDPRTRAQIQAAEQEKGAA